MLGISLTVLFSALAAFAVWSYYINPALKSNVKKDNNAMYIIVAAAVAFILRLILGAVYRGHNTDMSCFIGWSNAVFENGFGKFYTLDMFHDYPPGYMYVLYIVGAIENFRLLYAIFSPVYLYIKLQRKSFQTDFQPCLRRYTFSIPQL